MKYKFCYTFVINIYILPYIKLVNKKDLLYRKLYLISCNKLEWKKYKNNIYMHIYICIHTYKSLLYT